MILKVPEILFGGGQFFSENVPKPIIARMKLIHSVCWAPEALVYAS